MYIQYVVSVRHLFGGSLVCCAVLSRHADRKVPLLQCCKEEEREEKGSFASTRKKKGMLIILQHS